MTSLRPTQRPGFFWQAGLILLPVLIIAVVALTAIIENRTVVGRDARRRAEEVARQYGKELERPWGAFLMQHDRYSQYWSDYLEQVAANWPGGAQRTGPEAEAARSPGRDLLAQLAEWQAQYPELRAEEVFPDRFGLTAEGRFQGGLEFNPAPQPPAWFTGFSFAQRSAWEALKAEGLAVLSSKVTAVWFMMRPKLIPVTVMEAAEPTLREAVTAEPTARMVVPFLKKPRLPERVTKLATVAEKPLTAKAVVLAAMVLMKV